MGLEQCTMHPSVALTICCCLPLSLCSAAQPGQQGQQQEGGFNKLLGTILRFALMWYMMQYFKGNQQPAATPSGASAPLYRKGELVDMYVFLSESPIFSAHDRSNAQLIWNQTELELAAGAERLGSFVYRPTEVRGRRSACRGRARLRHCTAAVPGCSAASCWLCAHTYS